MLLTVGGLCPELRTGPTVFELTNKEIRQTIQLLIDEEMIPQPGTPPTIGVGYLANNINIDDENGFVTCISEGAFGYHFSLITTKSDFMYSSAISSANDACVQTTCSPAPQLCHLSLAQLQLARQTMVTSHEFAEMLTNPHANAWFDDSDPSQQGEVADTCRTNTDPTAIGTITVGPEHLGRPEDLQCH